MSTVLAGVLLDLVPDPMWIVDETGALTQYNAAFDRWWILVAGDPPTPSTRPSNVESLGHAQFRALQGRSVMIDLHLIVDGTERMYAVDARPLHSEQRVTGAAFIARELSESASAGEAAIELSLSNIFSAGSETLPEMMGKALEFIGSLEGWDGGVIWVAEEGDVHRIRPQAVWFADSEMQAKLASRFEALEFDYGHGVPGRTWATGEVVWIPDVLEESTMQRAELFATSGFHSVAAAPLTDTVRTIGVLEFFTRAVRPLSERRRRTLLRTGIAMGRLVARRRMEDDRQRLLALVQRKSDEWMLTFDALMLPIFVVGRSGMIVRLNKAARDLAGGDYTTLVGTRLLEIGGGEPWRTLADTAAAVLDAGVACSAQITTPEATWDLTSSLLWASEHTEQLVVLVLRDLTQVLSLQDAVRRGEQLAALGELVAGVAHEVKNPIFGMTATIDLLVERCSGDDEQLELLEAQRMWLTRLDVLTENLLEYGRTWSVNLVPGTVREVIRQTVESCEHRATAARVAIDVDVPASDPLILMDSARLFHVFENLIMNAVQFSPRGTTISITSDRQGDEVCYSVRDRGPGFDPADLHRVFQPFYTRRRGGTGLGLSIVQRVIDEHGGAVVASNAKEGGAVVTVRFPVYHQPA